MPLRAQVPLDRLLLETDAPDGLPRLSGAEAADLVPVPEPPSADSSCSEQHERQEAGGGEGSEAAPDAAGGRCSSEHQGVALAWQEAEGQPGEGSGVGGSAAAGKRVPLQRCTAASGCSAEHLGAATGTDGLAHGELRTGEHRSGHAEGAYRPQLNHPANIRCPAVPGWLLLPHALTHSPGRLPSLVGVYPRDTALSVRLLSTVVVCVRITSNFVHVKKLKHASLCTGSCCAMSRS